MRVVAVGLNHQTAPLALRDRVAVPASQLGGALDALRSFVERGVVLSTCNRFELYTIASSDLQGSEALRGFVTWYHHASREEVEPYLYTYSQEQAVRHLFGVSSGLNSLILGESQILGQVREAYGTASRAKMAGGALARLFHQALRVGKRARKETGISRNALSISRAAVELARRSLGDLASRRVLVIGVGDAGKLAARALVDAGATEVTVTNRTYAGAAELAAELGGRAHPFEELPGLLENADIAVTATGSPSYIVTPEVLGRARVASRGPLFLIDIAVPRDVDPAVNHSPDVHLFDIDDLETVAETNRRHREKEGRKVQAIVDEEVEGFMQWLHSLEVVPTVASLHRRAESIRQQEVSKALKYLPSLSEQDQATLEAFSKALTKKLLHRPITSLKNRRDPYYTQAAHDLFVPDEEGEEC